MEPLETLTAEQYGSWLVRSIHDAANEQIRQELTEQYEYLVLFFELPTNLWVLGVLNGSNQPGAVLLSGKGFEWFHQPVSSSGWMYWARIA